MKLATKLFLLIFLGCLAISSIAIAILYRHSREELTHSFESRYATLSQHVIQTIRQLDRSTEDQMQTALVGAYEYMQFRGGTPSNSDLDALRKRLGVSSIDLVRDDGEFVRSTSYDAAKIPNLFKLCGEYRRLFNRQKTVERTPLMPSLLDGRVFKFVLGTSPQPRYVINIGVAIEFVGKTLSPLFDLDHDIASIGLYTPAGVQLGVFSRHGRAREFSDFEQEYEIATQFPATVPECCECVTKKMTLADSKAFYYTLRMRVSRASFWSALLKLRRTVFWTALAAFLVSFGAAWLVSRAIGSRIRQINLKAGEIRSSRDLSRRLEVRGGDEIADMGEHFDAMLQRLEDSQKELVKAEHDRVLARVSSQVAHDVQSPLASLEIVMSDLQSLPEDKRILVRNAVHRIKDIVNNLLSKTREVRLAEQTGTEVSKEMTREPVSVQLLSGLVEAIVSEKRQEYRGRPGVVLETQLGSSAYGLFAAVQPVEFKRTLSNLINNAMESIEDSGFVSVSVKAIANQVVVEVRDTGKGISPTLLPLLGSEELTFGKTHGTGLGLLHARQCARRWDGVIQITSSPGNGTTVALKLPRAEAPSWFVPEIRVSNANSVVVLDDDPSIHDVWATRFSDSDLPIEMKCFASPMDLTRWFLDQPLSAQQTMVMLVDYEMFGYEGSGLDVIERLDIKDRSFLITSRYEEPAIRKRCEHLGVKLIPKGLAGFVPIVSTT